MLKRFRSIQNPAIFVLITWLFWIPRGEDRAVPATRQDLVVSVKGSQLSDYLVPGIRLALELTHSGPLKVPAFPWSVTKTGSTSGPQILQWIRLRHVRGGLPGGYWYYFTHLFPFHTFF